MGHHGGVETGTLEGHLHPSPVFRHVPRPPCHALPLETDTRRVGLGPFRRGPFRLTGRPTHESRSRVGSRTPLPVLPVRPNPFIFYLPSSWTLSDMTRRGKGTPHKSFSLQHPFTKPLSRSFPRNSWTLPDVDGGDDVGVICDTM